MEINKITVNEQEVIKIEEQPVYKSDNLVKSGSLYFKPDIYKDDSNSQFSIGDAQGNQIVCFKNGNIKTMNFDSQFTPSVHFDDSSKDFNIGDQNGNVILQLSNGHIKTKNFDSRNSSGDTQLDLTGKNVLFFGDSITYYKEYVNSFTSITNCNAYNRGLGSSCISNGGTGVPSSFCTRIDLADDNRQDGAGMTIGLPNNSVVKIDYVILQGGINDFGYTNGGNKTANLGNINAAIDTTSKTSFYGGAKYVINTLKGKYPDAKICVLGLIPTYSPTGFSNWSQVILSTQSDPTSQITYRQTTEAKTWFDYNNALFEVAKLFGATFISLENMGMHPMITADRTKYYKDGLHPNNKGGELIAKRIIENIKNINS